MAGDNGDNATWSSDGLSSVIPCLTRAGPQVAPQPFEPLPRGHNPDSNSIVAGSSSRAASPAPSAVFSVATTRRDTGITVPDDFDATKYEEPAIVATSEGTESGNASPNVDTAADVLRPKKRDTIQDEAAGVSTGIGAKRESKSILGIIKRIFKKKQKAVSVPTLRRKRVDDYLPLLDQPVPCSVKPRPGAQRRYFVEYDKKKTFTLVKHLDKDVSALSSTFLAVDRSSSASAAATGSDPEDEAEPKLEGFFVVKAYPKYIPGEDELAGATSTSAVRKHIRVFQRMCALKDHERRFLLLADGIVQDALHLYIVIPVMRCSMFDALRNAGKPGAVSIWAHTEAWIAQLISAVRCLHGLGILHRNITPGHIFLDHDGSLRLSDFSRAYIEDAGVPLEYRMSYAYRCTGTWEYMAPEVREQETRKDAISKFGRMDFDEKVPGLKGYGKEADVWSLGCVFAEILRYRRDDAPKKHEILFPVLEEDMKLWQPWAHDEYCIVPRDHCYEFYAKVSPNGKEVYLEKYGIANIFDRHFVSKFLQIKPYKRTTLEDVMARGFFTSDGKTLESHLKRRIPISKRPDFEVKWEPTAEPTHDQCKITAVAPTPQGRPTLDSFANHGFANPCGRYA